MTHSSEANLHDRVGKPKYAFFPPTAKRNSAFLNIKNVSIWDSGEYLFYCADDTLQQISFCLEIEDEPRAKLSIGDIEFYNNDLFTIGDSFTFICQMTSKPQHEAVKWNICDVITDEPFNEDSCEELIYYMNHNDTKVT